MLQLVQGTHPESKVHGLEADLRDGTYHGYCGSWINSWARGNPRLWVSSEPHKEITCKHCLRILKNRKPHLFEEAISA